MKGLADLIKKSLEALKDAGVDAHDIELDKANSGQVMWEHGKAREGDPCRTRGDS